MTIMEFVGIQKQAVPKWRQWSIWVSATTIWASLCLICLNWSIRLLVHKKCSYSLYKFQVMKGSVYTSYKYSQIGVLIQSYSPYGPLWHRERHLFPHPSVTNQWPECGLISWHSTEKSKNIQIYDCMFLFKVNVFMTVQN